MYSFTQPFCFLCVDFISTLCFMVMIFQDSSYQMELCGIQFPADFGLHLLHLLCVCSLLCTCVQKYWKGTMEFQVSSWHIHSKGTGKRGHIVADTLLPTQMFPHLPARNICCGYKFCVRDTKMFLILFRNILCPQQMFPSLRAQGNVMSNNVSTTMCPRLPVA